MESIEDTFKARTQDIDSIFSSFRDLHEMYLTVLKSANVNTNPLQAFERLKGSADRRQTQISTRLYSQGFILLTGAAEALLKDIFEDLLIKNFATISGAKGLSFTTKELQKVLLTANVSPSPLNDVSASLGQLTIEKLFKERNPTEKINFQNVLTTRSVFLQWFGIDIPDSDGLHSIHRDWQVRHILIHNDAKIDERFRSNVETVGLLTEKDKLGATVKVTKAQYNQCEKDLTTMFQDLDSLIRAAALTSKFVEY